LRLQRQASFPNTETLSTSLIRRHPLTGALVALAALAALLVSAAPAAAAPSCGRQVIDDWYDDGRVDGTYALHCYDDAIEALPRDVRDYSSAKEDIERALQARLRGEPAPPASSDPSPAGEDPDDPVSNEDPDDSTGTGSGTGSGSDPDAGGAEAAGETDGESASSVPLPLLVLAGLALLLIAGGSAGYLVRRFRGGEAPPPAV
jgi:hypothetical protein